VATIDHYQAVEELVGSRDRTQGFFRLFMLPGADHCGLAEGPGIRVARGPHPPGAAFLDAGFDPLTALERWAELGEVPESLLTTKMDAESNVLWTRPACPYPQREVYRGQGDVNEAASFDCVDP
jgi:hypothetical protein